MITDRILITGRILISEVPKADGAVRAARGKHGAPFYASKGTHEVCMPLEDSNASVVGKTPEANGLVVTAGC